MLVHLLQPHTVRADVEVPAHVFACIHSEAAGDRGIVGKTHDAVARLVDVARADEEAGPPVLDETADRVRLVGNDRDAAAPTLSEIPASRLPPYPA